MERKEMFEKLDALDAHDRDGQHKLHCDYWAQFVTEADKEIVKSSIGLPRILASTDRHMNDIPIKEWDMLPPPVAARNGTLREAGETATMSSAICIHKTAARQLKAEAA